MPESPPVINALRPARRPEPRYLSSPWSGRGSIFPARPGQGCDCSLKGGLGNLLAGSCNATGRVGSARSVDAACDNLGRAEIAATAEPKRIASRRVIPLDSRVFIIFWARHHSWRVFRNHRVASDLIHGNSAPTQEITNYWTVG